MSDFDQRARDWDNDPSKWARAEAVADGIRAAVPLRPEMTALEYGCGTGLLSFALHRDLGRITLADSSPGMLQVLSEKIGAAGIDTMTPIRLDLAIDPLPADRFALVCTMMTMHHVADVAAILRGFHALLADGGYLCIADLDREDGSFHGPGFDGHHGFERTHLAAMTVAAGFQPPLFATVFTMDKATDGVTRQYPVFLMTAQKG